MKTVYIAHGWGNSSKSNWIPWVAQNLKDEGCEVIALDFPDPDEPRIGSWVEHLRSKVSALNKDVYFIGHSVGCQTIMRFLELIDVKVGGAIFVAGWFTLNNLETKEEEEIAEPWIKTPIDFAKVRSVLPKSILMLSDNDPWVPFEETKKAFETNLGSEVVVLPRAGHITADDGFGPFPQLIEAFRNVGSDTTD